jgi:hypothetical protein
MNHFEYLLLAHLLLDYPLQGSFLGIGKSKYNFLLLVHVVMWALGIAFALQLMSLYAVWKLQMLFWGHLVMDYLKCRRYLVNWCMSAYIKLYPDSYISFELTPHVPPEAHKIPDWVTDNLGLSLWVDQFWHIIQLLLCLL